MTRLSHFMMRLDFNDNEVMQWMRDFDVPEAIDTLLDVVTQTPAYLEQHGYGPTQIEFDERVRKDQL